MVYVDQEKFVPEFVVRKRIEVVVNDSNSQKILEDVKNQEKFMVRYFFMMFLNLLIYLKILKIV